MKVYLISVSDLYVIGYANDRISALAYASDNEIPGATATISSPDQLVDELSPESLGQFHNNLLNEQFLMYDHDDEDALNDIADEIWAHLTTNIIDYPDLPEVNDVAIKIPTGAKPPTPTTVEPVNASQPEGQTLQSSTHDAVQSVMVDPITFEADQVPEGGEPIVMTVDPVESVESPMLKHLTMPLAGDPPVPKPKFPKGYKISSRGPLWGVLITIGKMMPGETTHHRILYNYVVKHNNIHNCSPKYEDMADHFIANYKGALAKDAKLAKKFIRSAVRAGYLEFDPSQFEK